MVEVRVYEWGFVAHNCLNMIYDLPTREHFIRSTLYERLACRRYEKTAASLAMAGFADAVAASNSALSVFKCNFFIIRSITLSEEVCSSISGVRRSNVNHACLVV
jgi:hypothetical protein